MCFLNVHSWVSFIIDEIRNMRKNTLIPELTVNMLGQELHNHVIFVALSFNMQRASVERYHDILKYIQHFNLTIVWIMEAWIDLAFPSYYKAYKVNDIYHSVLWVHDLYEQGQYFTKLKKLRKSDFNLKEYEVLFQGKRQIIWQYSL